MGQRLLLFLLYWPVSPGILLREVFRFLVGAGMALVFAPAIVLLVIRFLKKARAEDVAEDTALLKSGLRHQQRAISAI